MSSPLETSKFPRLYDPHWKDHIEAMPTTLGKKAYICKYLSFLSISLRDYTALQKFSILHLFY